MHQRHGILDICLHATEPQNETKGKGAFAETAQGVTTSFSYCLSSVLWKNETAQANV